MNGDRGSPFDAAQGERNRVSGGINRSPGIDSSVLLLPLFCVMLGL
jgi:hypothetical protein